MLCRHSYSYLMLLYFRLEDLFYAQGVDLIIQAHEHSYERLWPLYNDTIYSPYTGAAGNLEDTDSIKHPSTSLNNIILSKIKKNLD